jgi:hypothetical protein
MFRWIKHDSDRAAAAMVVARVCCKGMSIDRAIHETLHNGLLCHFPDDMPDREVTRFRLIVDEHIQKSNERRKENERNEIASSRTGIFQGREKLRA